MSDQLKYLDSPSTVEFDATVQRVDDDEVQVAVVLNQSYFYPQGGGQPSDTGSLTGDGVVFKVRKVLLRGDDVIHYGVLLEGALSNGQLLHGVIDADVRRLHSQLHTAGHVVMTAVDNLRQLPAVKGYHFPDGPYVEFKGTLPVEDREQFPGMLQDEIERILTDDAEVGEAFESVDSLRERGVFIPMELPTNKPTRVVTTAGYESPCGGTHVQRLAELRGLRIRGVKAKSGNTKVSYEIAV